jgi:hypothetical protein
MNITVTPKIALAALVSLSALLFALGASTQNDSDARWSISAVAGDNPGAYVIDQNSGEIYFVKINPNIGGRELKIKRLGNISEAK